MSGVWLSLGILALLASGGCRHDVRAANPAANPSDGQKYRLERPLPEAETLLKRPVRAARPRGPAYRLDNGLGSPIT